MKLSQISKNGFVVLSALVAFGCDNGGSSKGGGQNTTPVIGVATGTYGSPNQEHCEVSSNSYICYGMNGLNTGTVSFNSREELCSLLVNEQRNNSIAYSYRQTIYQQSNCNQNSTGQVGPYNPGQGLYPNGQGQYGQGQFKNIQCQVTAQKGQDFGDTGIVTIPVMEGSSLPVDLPGKILSQKTYFGGFFQRTMLKTVGHVKLNYISGGGMNDDRIRLSVSGVDGDTTATVEGYAGSKVELQMSPGGDYGDSYMNVWCKVQLPQNNRPILASRYECSGTESSRDKKSQSIGGYIRIDSDSIQTTRALTDALAITLDGTSGVGTAQFTNTSKYTIDSQVTATVEMSRPAKFSVTRSGYSASVSCSPKN